MEFKHSPAPWAVDDNGIFFEITREDGLRVADVCSSKHLYDDSKHHRNGVACANACLIAAAPELLSELIRLRNIVASYKQDSGDNLDITDVVIAKALGQQ
ncbi:hypothetical protein [Providencia sp. PROV138]|uniref:hypothetical protein n=1 Tax=Providencia sp. PROV138 TaxID=2949848 RepID=UPI00234A07D8|nr:hypothetical protein [Providencia sp. PROV138]